ncbi:MAG: ABC transporter substrate-binding protein [Solirubrobacterales bacterium]
MTVTVKGVAIVLAVLAAVVGLAACGSSGGSSSSSPADSAATEGTATTPVNDELNGKDTIGAILPLTGSSAAVGKDLAQGMELAVARVNSEGGVLGKELEVLIEDTEGATTGAVQAARKLVTSNHVPLVIGEYLSADTIAAGKYLQSNGIVHINSGSSSAEIADIGPYSFSTIGLDTLTGAYAAETLWNAGVKKIAFLGANNTYGAEFAKVLAEKFPELGGEVVESILYTEGQSSYQSELNRLKESDAEMYVLATYGPDNGPIYKGAFQLGMNPEQFYGIYLSICIEGVEPQAIAGQQGQDLGYIGASGEQYVEEYEARFGEPPATPYSDFSYDAVMMAAAAINEAESTDPAAIQQALKEVGNDYEGASGTITFDSDNQREEVPFEILKVDDAGEMVPQPEFVKPEL